VKVLFLLLFAALFLNGKIIEAPNFSEIEKYVDADTLVLLDIDETLLVPSQTLGTDVWFRHEFEKNKKAGVSDPRDQTLALWEAIRHLTQVEVVEKGADRIVDKMQKQGIRIMGLTTQGLALATRTANQLQSLYFDLTKTAPSQEEIYFQNGREVLYRKGILFTNGSAKGSALLKFFELAKIRPKRVVFLNDKQCHLEDVEMPLEKVGIPFIGLRYGYSDARVERFRPEIADIQLRHSSFGRILSDTEAEKIFLNSAEANPAMCKVCGFINVP
jgi:uncharacterized protein DUF2608